MASFEPFLFFLTVLPAAVFKYRCYSEKECRSIDLASMEYVAEQERLHQAAVVPFSWVDAGQQPQQWLAELASCARYSGMALTSPLHDALQHSLRFVPPHRATSFVPPFDNYKPAPTRASALAPPAGKASMPRSMNPYVVFCREQRPLLPTSLRNAEREQTLGMRIDCVDNRVPQPASRLAVQGTSSFCVPY